jgi:cytochrome d ubiquinol oxidase subunit I
LPLPWVAAELGWYVAEGGRQPWTIDGVLPTFLSASNVPASNVVLSLAGFVIFYSVLAVVELYLMVRTIQHGPEDLIGLPQLEQPAPAGAAEAAE